MNVTHGARIDLAEFKQGFHVLLICIIGVITSAGVTPLYTFGPLVQPLEQAFGWSRGEVQGTMTFFFIGLVVSSPVAAWLIGRIGLRGAVLISLPAVALGYAGLTLLNPSLWTLYLGYFLLPILGAGTLQVAWTQLISLWFIRNRGLALALVLTGTGLCAVLITPVVARAVEMAGWQTAFLCVGALTLIITLPLVYFWMPAQGPGHGASSGSANRSFDSGISYSAALRTRHFWLITIGLACTVIGVLGMLTNSVPLMIDNGVPAATAASVFGAFGIALIIGRTAAGYLIDRLWAPGVAFVTLTLPALGCLIFGIEHDNIAMLVIASMLIGIGAGAEFDFASFLIARYFGVLSYSRIFSVFFAVSSLFTCITPMLFGRLYDLTGSYQPMLWICGLCFVIGPLLLLLLGPYPQLREESMAADETAERSAAGA